MYNLRTRPERAHGFYSTTRIVSASTVATVHQRSRRRARLQNDEAHFVSLVKRSIIEGLKFKARPALVQRAKIPITKTVYQALQASGFDRKWRNGSDWLTYKQLPTKRLDSQGQSISIKLETFRCRVATKKPIRYYNESLSPCFTDTVFFFYFKYKTYFWTSLNILLNHISYPFQSTLPYKLYLYVRMLSVLSFLCLCSMYVCYCSIVSCSVCV